MFTPSEKYFLFSIDLEDIRFRMPDGEKYAERVPAMVDKYLEFLSRHNSKCTWFTVGDVARKYPSIIKMLADEGHEIACHTDLHIPLTKLNKESFSNDLKRNIESLYNAGAKNIMGFRAPIFSLTPNTQWAYEVLEQQGIVYSSSVLPNPNPFYGWPNFGENPRMVGHVLEIPMTLGRFFHLRVPIAGGVYFRLYNYKALKLNFDMHYNAGRAVVSYFHPYDIDTEQERFMHPDLNGSKLYNFLMYYNRKSVLPRLDSLMHDMKLTIVPYRDYIADIKPSLVVG
jgi:polysaccharide deacetylase family protein (PEP-CTERM system associated)